MKTTSLIIICLFFNITFSQSLEETIGWIGQNTDGREQVSYDQENHKLSIISVRQFQNLLTAFVKEIDPNSVNSIGIIQDKNGWNSVVLNFKDGYANVKSYMRDKDFKVTGSVTNNNRAFLEIKVECDKEKILKFKKAFLHLFKTIGVQVKDGDLF
ncbi:hypothetical protein DI383_02470 [Flavobacteriaceae bacterium LYZ1037]|nr:hypothetical protein DI383_02470 [Flavobacteriaceae bacterium LYZ1037]